MAFHHFLEGIAKIPIIRDPAVSYGEKTGFLIEEASSNPVLKELYIVDVSGVQHFPDGRTEAYGDDVWFKEAIAGKKYTAEPYTDPTKNNELFISFSMPVYDDHKNTIGVLGADMSGLWLSEQVQDIHISKTRFCTIVGHTGTTIAHKNSNLVSDRVTELSFCRRMSESMIK